MKNQKSWFKTGIITWLNNNISVILSLASLIVALISYNVSNTALKVAEKQLDNNIAATEPIFESQFVDVSDSLGYSTTVLRLYNYGDTRYNNFTYEEHSFLRLDCYNDKGINISFSKELSSVYKIPFGIKRNYDYGRMVEISGNYTLKIVYDLNEELSKDYRLLNKYKIRVVPFFIIKYNSINNELRTLYINEYGNIVDKENYEIAYKGYKEVESDYILSSKNLSNLNDDELKKYYDRIGRLLFQGRHGRISYSSF